MNAPEDINRWLPDVQPRALPPAFLDALRDRFGDRVGLHKMDFLTAETGHGAVDMMCTLKRSLDPKNILNPGKTVRVD